MDIAALLTLCMLDRVILFFRCCFKVQGTTRLSKGLAPDQTFMDQICLSYFCINVEGRPLSISLLKYFLFRPWLSVKKIPKVSYMYIINT